MKRKYTEEENPWEDKSLKENTLYREFVRERGNTLEGKGMLKVKSTLHGNICERKAGKYFVGKIIVKIMNKDQ